MEINRHNLLNMAISAALGIAGALLAFAMHMPIPWMLGSLLICALATGAGLPLLALPGTLERWMRVAIGVSLGPSVAASVSHSSSDLPLAIAAAILITTLTVVLGMRWFESQTSLPRPSAYLTALPGGLSMLLAMAGDVGNRAQVVLAHTVRVVIVVVSISLLARFLGIPPETAPLQASLEWSNGTSPLLIIGLIVAGFYLAEKLHIAGGHVIFPMLITALLAGFTDWSLTPPPIVKTAAMLVFGIVLGHEVASGPRGSYASISKASALFTTMVMLLAAALAVVLTQKIDQSFLVLFLALAPGGIAEVSLVALALGLDAGLVALVHACRFLYIILVGPLGLKWLSRKP